MSQKRFVFGYCLDEDGNKVMAEGKVLPIDIVTEAVTLIGNMLGK